MTIEYKCNNCEAKFVIQKATDKNNVEFAAEQLDTCPVCSELELRVKYRSENENFR